MNWAGRAALPPVPAHAVVAQRVIARVEASFSEAADLEDQVERAFAEIEERQPALARFLGREIDQVTDETAQALGHFLGVVVFEAFAAAFGTRLRSLDDGAVALASAAMECDEELRRAAPDDALESDDVVAISQPHLVAFVREQLDAALASDEDGEPPDVDLEDVARIYRAVLVSVVALSAAVEPPGGASRNLMLA